MSHAGINSARAVRGTKQHARRIFCRFYVHSFMRYMQGDRANAGHYSDDAAKPTACEDVILIFFRKLAQEWQIAVSHVYVIIEPGKRERIYISHAIRG